MLKFKKGKLLYYTHPIHKNSMNIDKIIDTRFRLVKKVLKFLLVTKMMIKSIKVIECNTPKNECICRVLMKLNMVFMKDGGLLIKKIQKMG